jgi:protoporphyrin/coproporphyrin ferrochelatase
MGAMRYGNPSLISILKRLKKEYVSEVIVFPLYPQYSSSTTGSANEVIMREIKSWNIMPSVNFISQFYSHPSFIGALVSQIRKSDPGKFDHILFSYHGLPMSHIQRSHPEVDYSACDCENRMPRHGQFCYKATCYETTRILAEKLNLKQESFSTSFQSRLTNKWLTPFTDKVLTDLPLRGKKKVLVVAPSFVADCLETIVEIGDHYKALFKQSGGEELVLAESLNDNDEWADAIKMIAKI